MSVIGITADSIAVRVNVRQFSLRSSSPVRNPAPAPTVRRLQIGHDELHTREQLPSKLVADDALEPSTDPIRMRRAVEQLSVWLARAMQEGRAALNSLRTATTHTNDLAEALRRITEDGVIPSSIAVTFSVLGDSREMHPVVRDEIYRIGYEAIHNACTHSGASRLEVELRYANDVVPREIDNGAGIDPAVADRGKDGHFGLQGMRERAARIAAKLVLVSSSNSGTEIKLIVPGGIVFGKNKPIRRSLFSRIRAFFRSRDGASRLD